MPALSLVIPCYNESAGLADLVARCREVVSVVDAEIILVDNGSTDDSGKILTELLKDAPNLHLVTVEENQGYGYGILQGLKAAQAPMIGWTHADLQTDPMDIAKAAHIMAQAPAPDTLFIKGRRVQRPWGDRIFTLGMSVFETLAFGRILSDINAQPTLFPKVFYDQWQDPPHDFSLDLFAYVMAKRSGLDVRRFPVTFGERKHGVSSWNVDLRSKYKFIKRTLGYSLHLRRRLHR